MPTELWPAASNSLRLSLLRLVMPTQQPKVRLGEKSSGILSQVLHGQLSRLCMSTRALTLHSVHSHGISHLPPTRLAPRAQRHSQKFQLSRSPNVEAPRQLCSRPHRLCFLPTPAARLQSPTPSLPLSWARRWRRRCLALLFLLRYPPVNVRRGNSLTARAMMAI